MELDNVFEQLGIEFEGETYLAHKANRWSDRIIPGSNAVIIRIKPIVPRRAESQFVYEWTYTLAQRFGSKSSIEMVNRAKDEIISKVEKTRELERDWLNGPKAKELIELEKQETKAREEREAERKLKTEFDSKIYRLVHDAGISPDEHGSWKRGSDSHDIVILDAITDPIEMRKYLAHGEALALVADDRKRTYAKSSKWFPSNRRDLYLVGRNESGTAFAHSVINVSTIFGAYKWIWNNEDIIDRNGDVGIALAKKQFKKAGESKDIVVVDSHHVKGEIIQNGAIYARNAILYHGKEQHPDVKIGDEWHKIVVAKRSKKATSSRD